MAVQLAEKVAGTPYHFTVDEYMCMAEAGIFDEDSPVELIEGVIFHMAAIGGDTMTPDALPSLRIDVGAVLG